MRTAKVEQQLRGWWHGCNIIQGGGGTTGIGKGIWLRGERLDMGNSQISGMVNTGLGLRVDPRLRKSRLLAPSGHGSGVHAT